MRQPRPLPVHKPSLIFLLALAAAGPALGTDPASPQTFMVPMHDGVKLATDVFLPPVGQPPYPVVLVRTTYNRKAGSAGLARNITSQGYAMVVQDVRGRYQSEGKAVPVFGNEGLGTEHKDGHDTINWVAKQPWCGGRIVSMGGSALGIVQNMAAPNAPEALKGQIVQVAFSSYYHQAAYQGGVWRTELLERWLQGTGLTEGNLSLFKSHPYYDEFWKSLDSEPHAKEVNAPGLFWGGWYDIFGQGTINSFVNIQNNGGPGAKGKCALVMGPYAHGTFKELVYPPSSAQPIMEQVAYLAAWLKGQTAGIEKLKPVHYYVMGDTVEKGAPGNFWRYEDSWPPASDATPFYLHADGSLKRGTPPNSNDQKTYKYDPANPVPSVGGQNLTIAKGPMDQTSVESRPDVLLFTSDTLTEPLEVTGRITGKLYISSDCPDTDFTVKLTDVYPDGRSMLVTDGIRRASLRKNFEKPEFLKPGQLYEVEVDLWSTSLIFNKGHKICVAVSSSNSPRFEPNPNTGDPHPQPGKTRIATNTLHLSKDHASHIILPIYKGSAPR